MNWVVICNVTKASEEDGGSFVLSDSNTDRAPAAKTEQDISNAVRQNVAKWTRKNRY